MTTKRRKRKAELMRKWRAMHPERALELARESMRRWRQSHPLENFRRKKAWVEANRMTYREYQRSWRKKNRVKFAAYMKAWRERHKQVDPLFREKVRAQSRKQYWANPAVARRSAADWRKRNPGKCQAFTAKYRARKLKATLPGVDEELTRIYIQAKTLTRQTGRVHAVDHIWPLKGHDFSGLHVPWNLQILTLAENSRKSNKSPLEYARTML